MLISERPMFGSGDRSTVSPKDGLWLGEDPECAIDSSTLAASWPECATWIIVRASGANLELNDGKHQSQRLSSVFVNGEPMIIEAQYVDNAKHPPTTTYVYFALEPQSLAPDGHFTRASVWPVECGIQEAGSSQIRSFPGITPECRPESQAAIRAAATASRRSDQIKSWRWVRAEDR